MKVTITHKYLAEQVIELDLTEGEVRAVEALSPVDTYSFVEVNDHHEVSHKIIDHLTPIIQRQV